MNFTKELKEKHKEIQEIFKYIDETLEKCNKEPFQNDKFI